MDLHQSHTKNVSRTRQDDRINDNRSDAIVGVVSKSRQKSSGGGTVFVLLLIDFNSTRTTIFCF